MNISAGFVSSYRVFGLRGPLSLALYRVTGFPQALDAYPHGLRAVRLRLGTTDRSVYLENLVGEEYNFSLPAEPRYIVDAGANIGAATLSLHRRYPLARILAIEPEPANFAVLAHNVAPYPEINAIQAALSDRDGTICIAPPDPRSGASGEWGFVTTRGEGIPVPARRLNTLLAEYEMPHVDLLKMDIEGAEIEVLRDACWLQRVDTVFIELHERLRVGCDAAAERAFREFPFRDQRGETSVYRRRPAR